MEPMKVSDANRRVVTVVFDVAGYAGGDLTSGNHTWYYELKRDTATSPWLIRDWGGGGYEK